MGRVLNAIINLAVIVGMVIIGISKANQLHAEDRLNSITEADMTCLQQNIYWEARNQDVVGQHAVAWLTFNRVVSSKYPNTICGVVKQGHKNADGTMKRHRCQFSWYCDGKPDHIPNNVIEQTAWQQAGIVASSVAVSWAYQEIEDNPIGDSIMYHADYADPFWKGAYTKVVQIGNHIFYKEM